MKIKKSNVVLVFLILLLVIAILYPLYFPGPCKAKAIVIAANKAKELGYSPEEMTIKVTVQKDNVVVYFAPKATRPEEMILGGDLRLKSWFGFRKNIAVNCTGLVTEGVYPVK